MSITKHCNFGYRDLLDLFRQIQGLPVERRSHVDEVGPYLSKGLSLDGAPRHGDLQTTIASPLDLWASMTSKRMIQGVHDDQQAVAAQTRMWRVIGTSLFFAFSVRNSHFPKSELMH